jgi:hypothetical protein
MPSLSAIPASQVPVGTKVPGAGGDALGSEDGGAGAVDLPAAARGADAGGGDDDVELGGVPLGQQGDEVGRDPLR